MYTDKLLSKVKDNKENVDAKKVLLASLISRQAVLEKCDEEILEVLTEEADIMDEIENANTYADKIVSGKTLLELDIKHHDKKFSESKSVIPKSDPDKPSGSKIQIKLPSIEIEKYDGSLLSWSLFWDKFDVAVHSRTDLDNIQKYTYLKSYLIGEAKRSIQGISYDKDNYQNAVDALKSRFGNNQLRISAHMRELQNIKSVKNLNDVDGMRKMYDALEMNITNLKELKVDVSTYSTLLIAIIFDRIPEELRIKISLEFGDKEWKLDEAMELFKSELEARERSTAISGFNDNRWNDDTMEDLSTTRSFYVNSSNNDRRRNERMKRGGFNQNFHRNNRQDNRSVQCAFCKGSHVSSRCLKVTDIKSRYEIISREKRCFICLKPSHKSENCRLQFLSCVVCQKKHNIALCERNNQETPRTDAPRGDRPVFNSIVPMTYRMMCKLMKMWKFCLRRRMLVSTNPEKRKKYYSSVRWVMLVVRKMLRHTVFVFCLMVVVRDRMLLLNSKNN